MVKKLISLYLFLASINTYAMKYTIFTDEDDMSKANAVISEMKSTYPFNTFNIEFEIIKVKPEELNCETKMGIDRNVGCDTEQLVSQASRNGSDQVMVVKKMDKWGGSASIGGVPVITTGTSARVMIHEYLHVLGLCDEYEYSQVEADIYCEPDNFLGSPNQVLIEPLSSGYADDNHARGVHFKEIPWQHLIKETTPITNGGGKALGTGNVNYNQIAVVNNTTDPLILDKPAGLYKGKACNNATKKIHIWHPGGNSTIMDNYENGLGAPLENIVKEILTKKGSKQKENSLSNVEPVEIIQQAKPEVTVNNSPRNFFKSFFDAIESFFKSLFNVITQ